MKSMISEAISAIKHWWLILILGIFLVLGGIWVIQTPLQSYLALSILFIVLLLVNGTFQIIFSLSNRRELPGWGWYLSGGILEFLIGVYLLSYPAISMTVLPFVVGFWLIFRGISVIAYSTELKAGGVRGWGWLMVFGILLTIFSFLIIMNPVIGAVYLVIWTAFSLIFMGISYIMLAFKLKKIKSKALDVLEEYKNDSIAFINEMKQLLEENMKDIPDDVADKLKARFDEYEKNIRKKTK